MAIEDAVFLLASLSGDGKGTGVSFCCEVFRESQEKGLVNFLVGGAGAGRLFDGGGAGGGAHGTDGRAPDSPWRADLAFFGGRGGGDFEASIIASQSVTCLQ